MNSPHSRTADSHVLLVSNRPPNSGIGVYTQMLFQALQSMHVPSELYHWEGRLVEGFYSLARGHIRNSLIETPIVLAEEAFRIASQAWFFAKTPKGRALYHITNAALAPVVRRRNPSVVTVHDLVPYVLPRDLVDRLLLRSMRSSRDADRIICVSEQTRKELLEHIPVDENRIRVIRHGLRHDLFYPQDRAQARRALGLPVDASIVLHVGSEEPRKNIPTLLRAFQSLRKKIPNPLLVRVGETTPDTSRLIASLGLADSVRYFHNLPNLGLAYAAANVLCFPSTHEGFGLPPLEAMACGCPVVASNCTAIPEIVGQAGILVEPDDISGFTEAIIRVVSDPATAATLTNKGLQRASEFSWERCAQETASVYQELIGDLPRYSE